MRPYSDGLVHQQSSGKPTEPVKLLSSSRSSRHVSEGRLLSVQIVSMASRNSIFSTSVKVLPVPIGRRRRQRGEPGREGTDTQSKWDWSVMRAMGRWRTERIIEGSISTSLSDDRWRCTTALRGTIRLVDEPCECLSCAFFCSSCQRTVVVSFQSRQQITSSPIVDSRFCKARKTNGRTHRLSACLNAYSCRTWRPLQIPRHKQS